MPTGERSGVRLAADANVLLSAVVGGRAGLVSGGSEDPPERWPALNHTVAVNRLLSYTNRVAMTHRSGHNPTEESNGQIYAFFDYFLR